MPERLLRQLVERLWKAASPATADLPTDGELLDHYLRCRDQAAFELLVRRHGALVLGVCRRVLRDAHTAEDAFQATFLVLACKARSVRQQTIAAWLHRVALRIALRARRGAARRATRERPLLQEPIVEEVDRLAGPELRSILDDELARLPERLRLPVLLCYVEGHTTAHAAKLLNCPRGTVLSRLAAARQRLSLRLAKRGVGLAAAGVAVGLTESAASGAVSATLILAAVQAAFSSPLGKGDGTGVISAQAIQLAQGVLHAMFVRKLVCVIGMVLLFGTLAVTVGWVAAPTPAGATEPTAALAAQGAEPTRIEPKEDGNRPAQLDQARTVLAHQVDRLEEVEDLSLKPLLEARTKLLELEEKLRALEGQRAAAIAELHRAMKREDPEALPEVVEGRKHITLLTSQILAVKTTGATPDSSPQLKSLQDELEKQRIHLEQELKGADRRLRDRQQEVAQVERMYAGALLEVRLQILVAEEKVHRVERRSSREVGRATAAVDAAAARVRQLEGLPSAPESSSRAGGDLDRKLDELLREVAEIKRELKRQREGK